MEGKRDARDDPVLSELGFGMVITFMTLIMTKRLSPMVAVMTSFALALVIKYPGVDADRAGDRRVSSGPASVIQRI
jgi:hypothetical protein